MVAHSVGAVIAAAWVHDFAPPVPRVGPGHARLPGQALRPARDSRAAAFAKGQNRSLPRISSYVGGSLLTHDRVEARRYDADALISRQISVRVLLDLHDTATRLLDDAAAIRTPTLLLAAGSDAVVRRAPQRQFFERLSSPVKAISTCSAGFSHAIFHERDRQESFPAGG